MKTPRLSFFTLALFGVAFVLSSIRSTSAQPAIIWEAFNDYRPSDQTHLNVSGYDLRLFDDGGPLADFATGLPLDASVYVISESSPDDFGANTPVNAGSPADELFGGKVDVGNEGLPGLRDSNDVSLIIQFEGLDPTKRYNFRATASRGGGYDDRWAVYSIHEADAFVEAHVDGSDNQNIITKGTFDSADLEPNQVALNSGDNKVGSLVGWDNIEPGANGIFQVEARQYRGATPFGDSTASNYAYGFTAIYIAEIESSGNLRVTENPASQIVPAGQTVTLQVVASSPQAIEYQWQKAAAGTTDYSDIAGATQATYTTPALTVADDGTLFRSNITSGGSSTTSGEATINVDGTIPTIAEIRGSLNFNAVHLVFSESLKLEQLADVANYSISGGLTITAAIAQSSTAARILTSGQTAGDRYTVTVNNLQDLGGNTIAANSARSFTAFSEQPGTVGLEIWNNSAPGQTDPNDLKTDPRYPDSPDEEFVTTTFDSEEAFPNGPRNTYGGRFRAWLTPAETGDYEFFLQSDGGSELHVGENDDFAVIADVDRFPDASAGGGSLFQEPGIDDSVTFPINLKAGQRYAILAIWKESNGPDYFQLAWRNFNDFTFAEELTPIPTEFLSFYGPSPVSDEPGEITRIALEGGQVILEWTGGTSLQSSSDLTTWTDEAGATSPLSVTPTGAKFYRIRN